MLPDNFDELSLDEKIDAALESGDWMVRISDKGKAYGGFRWKDIGEWTHADVWEPTPACGQGLHGSALESWGYFSKYERGRFEFCATHGERVDIEGNKIKVSSAMILAVNNDAIRAISGVLIPYLDLSGTQITELPEGLSVGGYLDLSGTQITELPEGLSVGGSLVR